MKVQLGALVAPTVHMNGSGAEHLLESLQAQRQAVLTAVTALEEHGPNARDYYTQGPQVILLAQRQHGDRLEKLRAVYVELAMLTEAVREQVDYKAKP